MSRIPKGQRDRQIMLTRLCEMEQKPPTRFNRRRVDALRSMAAQHIARTIDNEILGIPSH